MGDREAKQKQKAEELRKAIEDLESGEESEDEGAEDMLPGESPKEYLDRKLRDMKRKKEEQK